MQILKAVDSLSTKERSERMRLIKSKGMAPEILVRRLVYTLGYRFRLHRKDLPGKPDLVFPRRGKAIFVHGCFWHRHPKCKRTRMPRSNIKYWRPKLLSNRKRDLKNQRQLKQLGWGILIIWECEVGNRPWLIKQIKGFLGGSKCKQ